MWSVEWGRLLRVSASGLAIGLLMGTAAASASGNLIANGTFEGKGSGSLAGWAATHGTLSLTGGDGGGHAAQLSAASSAPQASIYTQRRPVANAAAGTGYLLSGEVSGSVSGRSLCLVVKETPATGSTTVGSARSCVTSDGTWQSFSPVSYTVKTAGDRLSANVIARPVASGAVFAIDNLVLQAVSDSGQPPSVPQSVTATARGRASVAVSWSASTDDVGVAGYDVYRDGVQVGSVNGSTTFFTDSGLDPGTTYSYTVDAFDAAANVSAPSPAAVVTTALSGPGEPIVVIMMENKTYDQIVGNANAPYIQSLIAAGTLYTNYQAGPGSLPDYLANTSGLTFGTTDSDNIFNQLQGLGASWGEYEESMPSACYTGGDVGRYKQGHNPAVYYADITSSPAACANVVPYSQFSPHSLRAFSYVVPNLLDDMHNGPTVTAQIAAGDAWLAANVPAMLNAGAEVIVTWDEGNSQDEHVATIAIGGTATAGATDDTGYTHPGLLAGLETAWGLPLLNAAQTATPLPIT